ncbi:MAG: pyrroline-5-carboxylate reductase [Deltaproteobacteria bacterium]|nr:pyrroline-5-carboxylate reductase [Deltaproteobacteria bacterium]MBW2170845.1 pyrroline-5-carboxylate reductase [Deltaproteobacteria bacterium]MBW2259216.1 pyrroline-5-carboxylate reductase [Deltaproteobacteria bacterium]
MKKLGKKIGFIGAGNMGEAMIKGLIRSGLCEPKEIWASDVRDARLRQLKDSYGINITAQNAEAFDEVDIVILAVKPQHMDEVLQGFASSFPQTIKGVKLIMSIAAGFTMEQIEGHLYPPLDENSKGLLPVVRVMPNTPALVLAGMAGMSGNRFAKETDLNQARTIMEAVGKVITFEEEDLDAVTALSGSGPAYVYYFIESLVEAGAELGLRPSHALNLTIETIKGAAILLQETGEPVASLRKKVTSKGGTTEAALNVLERNRVKEHLIEAVRAAARRSKELSRSS